MYYVNINKMKMNVPQKYVEIIEKYKGKKKKVFYEIQCQVVEDLRRLWKTIKETNKPLPADER